MAFEIYLRNNETKVSLRLPYEAVNLENYVLVYLRTKKNRFFVKFMFKIVLFPKNVSQPGR